MDSLTPQERQMVHERMHADWKSMSEAQKKEMREMRQSMVGKLTPEEREEMRQERRRMYDRMSPDERQKWRDDMHRMRHSQGAPHGPHGMMSHDHYDDRGQIDAAPHGPSHPQNSR